MMIDPIHQSAKNILCIRLDNIGDVLMTTPAIRALKQSIPGAHITLLTSPVAESAAKLVPEIDDVLAYDAPWMKATASRQNSQPDHDWIAFLRKRRFDMAVIFTVFSQSALPAALTCFLADIPLRLAHSRENPYQLLTHWVRETELQGVSRHEVQRQLDLVGSIGCHATDLRLSIQVMDNDRDQALKKLAGADVDTTQPWVVIHPGASAPSRRYSPERYGEVARRVMTETGLQVILTGGHDESDLLTIVASLAPGVYSLPGQFTIGELAAVVDQSRLLITNNSGPAHIAAAAGTPVVVLYALTNPQHTPWQTPSRVLFHDVPCRNCYRSVCPETHHNCLQLVQPDQVIQATLDLLRETQKQPIDTGAMV
ncbi:MAG TPA: lipopolysaccharide heptosyltransferase II, partial [Anaerolineaceae bacterium]|nr:lipopolysaccharide heptosyltransferase II [Anaerolineaceae bacterium]